MFKKILFMLKTYVKLCQKLTIMYKCYENFCFEYVDLKLFS